MAKKIEKEDPHRQIIPSVIGEAAEICDWLEGLFILSPKDTEPGKPKTEPDSMPEKIVLRPVVGSSGVNTGPDLDEETWKPMVSPVPGREKLVQLANRFYASANKHCSSLGRKHKYALFAFNNLKGPSAYKTYFFAVAPGSKQYTDKNFPSGASDDEDTHRDRLLSTALAHNRWQQEQLTEAISGVMKLQNEIIRQQSETIARQDQERRAWILASEEALSKKQEREIAAAWAQAKISALADMWNSVKGLLPAVVIHATKGKVGIPEGLKTFVDGLSDETRLALFGEWDDGKCVKGGILDENQVHFIGNIIEGKIEPSRISEFMVGLRQEQMMECQKVLRPDQLQALIALAKAANDTAAMNGTTAQA